MRAVRKAKQGYAVSPSIGELLVMSAESVALSRCDPSPVKQGRALLAGGWMYLDVERHLREIRHPQPDRVIADLQPHVAKVIEAKRTLDAEVDRLLLLYRGRDGRACRDYWAAHNPSEDA